MRISASRRAFLVFNYVVLLGLAALCLIPMLHVVAVSFSSSAAAAGGFVKLWPVGFTTKTYGYILQRQEFLRSFVESFKRLLVGVPINLAMVMLVAYPLSKPVRLFRMRNVFAWYFVITMFISGGLIPLFMTMRATHLIDTIWALVLPNAVNVFNMLLMLNYIQNNIPGEIEEAALVDGAGYWRTLGSIILPLTMPCLATITLFSAVTHWNSWFDGLIFMNRVENYPLQSYLRTIIIEMDPSMMQDLDQSLMAALSDKTAKACQMALATVPILVVYPFLQKYFVTGVVVGSVKS